LRPLTDVVGVLAISESNIDYSIFVLFSAQHNHRLTVNAATEVGKATLEIAREIKNKRRRTY
jgi:hypothetical protein